jgi:hypothetical protein
METKQETIIPEVGMSVTYYIGSDAYHRIVVAKARNSRVVYTMNAEKVLGNLDLQTWQELPASIRRTSARNAWVNSIRNIFQDAQELYPTDEATVNNIVKRWKDGFAFTLRNDGYYISKGQNCGHLKVNSTYEYLDPSF